MLSSLKDKNGMCLTKWNVKKRKEGEINGVKNKKQNISTESGKR